jgi:hypothetical protein
MRVKCEFVIKYKCPKCGSAFVAKIPPREPTPKVTCLCCKAEFGLNVPSL